MGSFHRRMAVLSWLTVTSLSACADAESGGASVRDTVAVVRDTMDTGVRGPLPDTATDPAELVGRESSEIPSSFVDTLIVRPGLVVERIRTTLLPGSLVVASLDADYFEPFVAGVGPKNASGRSSLRIAAQMNAEVLISGGFLERFVPPVPLGLLVVEGAIVGPTRVGGFLSVLAIANQRLVVSDTASWRDVFSGASPEYALQTGPLLVGAGRVRIREEEPNLRDPFTRSFVATSEAGIVLVGITEDRVNLRPLAEFLARSPAAGGLGITEAVNLSAGGMEVLVVRVGDSTVVYGPGASVRQASVIGFRRRRDRE